MISLSEEFLTLREAAASMPGNPSMATVWRWANRGVRGCRLESFKRGGLTLTSREAIQRFWAKLNGEAGADVPKSPGKAAAMGRRQRELAASEAEAAAEGL